MSNAEPTKKKHKWWLIVLVWLLLPLVLFPRKAYYMVNAYFDAKNAGFMDEATKHRYSATSKENLKALQLALKLYYDSEGVMPEASGWMDAAKTYVRTADLKQGEEMKKFVNPRIQAGEGVFGYAYNSALSGAYLEDIKDPDSVILLFESKDTKWNANGDPESLQPDPPLDGGNNAITLSGKPVTVEEFLKGKSN